MSQVNDQIQTDLGVEIAIKAIRRCAKYFGSLAQLGERTFQIKDTVQRTEYSTSWPATVDIEVSGNTNSAVITFNSHNFGIGPIQKKECQSKLGAVKCVIQEELDSLKRESVEYPKQSNALDELMKLKQLLDAGAITKEEYDEKKKDYLK